MRLEAGEGNYKLAGGQASAPASIQETAQDSRQWRQDNGHLETDGGADAVISNHWYVGCKMAVEWLFALVLLVLMGPIILLAALVVKLTSRGPAFYSQRRLGYRGQVFNIHKIRTMRHNCEQLSGVTWARSNDPRITRVGRFLRKTHIDELPQLINVLRFEMSIVGPRPERPEFLEKLEEAVPHYRDRLLIRPGVTGIAQVQLPPDTDLASVRRKLAYDLYYIRYLSFWLDLRLIACTVVHCFGVPFHLLCIWFGMPRRADVERQYRTRPRSSPRLQLVGLQPS